MLGNEQSSLSSSTKRRECFSMYASTALVHITRPSSPSPNERGSGGISLLASAESSRGDQLACVVAGSLRRSAADRPAHPPLHLRRVVPLVPRHGRDDLLTSGRDRSHQSRIRAGPRRQRRPA